MSGVARIISHRHNNTPHIDQHKQTNNVSTSTSTSSHNNRSIAVVENRIYKDTSITRFAVEDWWPTERQWVIEAFSESSYVQLAHQ